MADGWGSGGDVGDGANAVEPVTPIRPRSFVALALVLVVLWFAADTLATLAHRKRHARSETLGREGARLLQDSRPGDAVELLREAVALEPANVTHRLTLGKALVALDHPSEALPYIQDVLAAGPVDGEANLVLARALRRIGETEAAEAAYYRAIYGRWREDPLASRVQPRLELVSLFRQLGQRERLRSALVELSAAFPGDRALQLQAGRELLEAGFADDAARQLRALVERLTDPGDGFTLLATAEFTRGHLADAYAAAGRAVRHSPGDRTAARLLRLTARMLSLDPDQPRLAASARRTRIRVLLSEARARLTACARTRPASPTVLPAVDRWLASRHRDGDVGRALLAAISAAIVTNCPAVAGDDAIGLVLEQLGGGRSS